MGDLFDLYSFGRWARSHNIMTPKQEIIAGRKDAEWMWSELRAACPKAECIQLWGNHDDRPIRKAIDCYPEIESLIDIHHLWQFPGVRLESESELILDGVCYMHGFRTRLGDHARNNMMSTVCGHSHRGGVAYIPLGNKVIWELNAGYLADRFKKPLQYTKERRFSQWTQGYGEVDEMGPRFIPFSE